MRQPQELVGLTLGGKYRLDALLGAGAYGAVYRGWHLALDLPVAVKVAFRVEGAFGKRFRREARTLMSLHHRHIVRVYDYDREPGGLVYLVQEFVAGRTLKAVLAEEGPLPPAVVVEIGCQTLAALAAAHAEGIVHRDIKLDNLMLAGDLHPPSVRLLDFGVAKLRQGDADASDLTHAGGTLGTPAYMAPEQIRGEPEPASDLYAVGVTLFYLLTGAKPFPQRPPEVYIAHLQHPVPLLPASVPTALAEVVRRALAKTPAERHASADEMSAALRAAMPGIGARPASNGPLSIGEALSHTTTAVDKVAPSGGMDWPDVSQTSAEMQGVLGRSERNSRSNRARPWVAVAAMGGVAAVTAWAFPWSSLDGIGSPSEVVEDTGVRDGSRDDEAGVGATVDAAVDAAVDEVTDAGSDADSSIIVVVDATPPVPLDMAARPPVPVAVKRQRQPVRPATPQISPVDRAGRKAQEALGLCHCDDAAAFIQVVRSHDAKRAEGLASAYRKKCLVVGLPGSCR